VPTDPPHLIVSTHFDDAVLSTFGVLDAAPGSIVLTVCAGVPGDAEPASEWDADAGFASGAHAALARAEEDRRACELARAHAVHLDWLDGPYRDREDTDALRATVAAHLTGATTLWIPAGIGGHADHVAVRDALLPLAASRPGQAAVYLDLPYSAFEGWEAGDADRPPARRWEPHVALLHDALRLGDCRRIDLAPEVVERKLAAVACHASQVPGLQDPAPWLLEPDGALRHERWWPVVA
jgi:LmbE family N-acetylglucosaminyl deacetylase